MNEMPVRFNKFRKFLFNLSLFFFSLLICLVVFEGILRLVDEGATNYALATEESLFWRYDSLLGWSMKPLSQGQFTRPEFSTHVQTNSLGFRDDEISKPKPKNEFRILLLGDSVVAGFEVEREETLEWQLESLLNALGKDLQYQVINSGCRGYGTDQELLFLESSGFNLEPDLVILAFVPANDLENNVTVHTNGRLYSKPYFTYAIDSTLVLKGVPVPRVHQKNRQIFSPIVGTAKQALSETDAQKNSRSIKKILSENLYIYSFLASRLKSAPPEIVAALKKFGIIEQTVPEEWVEFYRNPLSKNWKARWQITLDLLKAIDRKCKNQKIPFMVWMFPLKEQVSERDEKIFLQGYGLKKNLFDFELPVKILAAFCKEHDITFYSPLSRFRVLARNGKRFHFISDNHFNAEGHKVIAAELFRFLKALDLI